MGDDKNLKIDLSAKLWRQVGYWGITLNIILLPIIITVMKMLDPNNDVSVLINMEISLLTAFCTCAGIRQMGKKHGTEK